MSRFRTWVATAVLALAAPGLALAADPAPPNPPPGMKAVMVCKPKSQEDINKSKTKGTVIGAVAGGLLGGGVAGHGAKTEGAVLGAGVGALAGRQIAKKQAKKDQECHYEYVKK
jgi:uncharacterized protein YcfJ